MTKLKPFLVEYEEVQKQSYIVYAEDEEQASEIMEKNAKIERYKEVML